jgi:uncharacterized protein (TIGR02646 family)
MIRIARPPAPSILANRGAAATKELCGAFDRGETLPPFDKSIYADSTVKDALRQAQHGKCAFCESFVPHIASGDIEHFRPKAGFRQRATDDLRQPGYFWLAFAWENLLFVCELCNRRFKRNLFPLRDGRRRARPSTRDTSREEPLFIDPSLVDPSDHIGFREADAFPVGGSAEGEMTIEALGLNRDPLRENRLRRLEDLTNLIELINLLRSSQGSAAKQQLQSYEEKLAAKTHPHAEYAAMARAYLGRG